MDTNTTYHRMHTYATLGGCGLGSAFLKTGKVNIKQKLTKLEKAKLIRYYSDMLNDFCVHPQHRREFREEAEKVNTHHKIICLFEKYRDTRFDVY